MVYVMRKPKISKVKYCLADIDYICPECGHKFLKETDGEYAKKFTACKDKLLSYSENYCPYCNHKFDNTELLNPYSIIDKYVSDPIVKKLFNYMFYTILNANDFFGIACADDEALDIDTLSLYFILVYEYKIKPNDAIEALMEWNRGSLRFGSKMPSKALKIIRKLLGHKWYPYQKEI